MAGAWRSLAVSVRLEAGHRLRLRPAQAPVHAVIAGRECKRRAKWQLAAAAGLPLLTPAWVTACASAATRAPMSGAVRAWLPANSNPAGPLAGLRVHLAGAAGFRAQYAALLPHAGDAPLA